MDNPPNTNLDNSDTSKGAAAYTPLLLKWLYDPLVLGLYFTHAWRCPTTTHLLPFFTAHTSRPDDPSSPPARRLLDIGVGTGYFLEQAPLASTTDLVLVDLNPNCLDAAAARARKAHPHLRCSTVQADFLAPCGLAADGIGGIGDGGKFDAISLMLLLHCVPGPPARKAAALVGLKHLLAEDRGVLFGATVLGRGETHNWFGRWLMWLHNKKGTFDNREDEVASFVGPLEEHFESVEWRVVGVTLLFEARGPRL